MDFSIDSLDVLSESENYDLILVSYLISELDVKAIDNIYSIIENKSISETVVIINDRSDDQGIKGMDRIEKRLVAKFDINKIAGIIAPQCFFYPSDIWDITEPQWNSEIIRITATLKQ